MKFSVRYIALANGSTSKNFIYNFYVIRANLNIKHFPLGFDFFVM